MDEHKVLQLLKQVSKGESGQVFREHLRGAVRTMGCEVMAAAAPQLCGKKHSQPVQRRFVLAVPQVGYW